jgi:hypothetical protein
LPTDAQLGTTVLFAFDQVEIDLRAETAAYAASHFDQIEPAFDTLQASVHAVHPRRERGVHSIDSGDLTLDMAEPLAELGHIGLDTVDAFVETGEVDAEEIENFVSHSNNPGFRREEHTMRGALGTTSC